VRTQSIAEARVKLAALGLTTSPVPPARELPARVAERVAMDEAAAEARTVRARQAIDVRRRQRAFNQAVKARRLPIAQSEPYALSVLTALTLWEGMAPRSAYATDFERHIRRVAALHDVRLVWGSAGVGSAYLRSRVAHVPRPLTDVAYAAGLHELGHLVISNTGMRQVPDGQGGTVSPESEIVAWKWARRACLFWTAAMQTLLCVALRSYGVYATSRELREFEVLMSAGEIRR
jgi:hypothetical protein